MYEINGSVTYYIKKTGDFYYAAKLFYLRTHGLVHGNSLDRTAFHPFRRTYHDRKNFPFNVYGMACIIKPLYRYFKKIPALFRGFIYSTGIFCFEYLSGSLLKKHHLCPWDYSNAPTNINGVIRLDYAPVWMAAGLIFEKILSK